MYLGKKKKGKEVNKVKRLTESQQINILTKTKQNENNVAFKT